MTVVGEIFVAVRPETRNFAADTEKGVLGAVSGIAKKAAAILGGAFALQKGVSFLKDSIADARESNKVAAQTEAVIKSTGAAAGLTAKQFADLATAVSNKTGVDDEAVQSAENLLATFTKVRNEAGRGNDVFSQATSVLVDMGKALGGDASSSAIQLGKALNDPIRGITALTRVGVTFSEKQKEQIKGFVEGGRLAEAQKVILAELRTEFGGSAAAQATAADRLRVVYGNIREDIGNRLIPVIDRFARLAADVLPKGLDLAGKAGARLQRTLAPVFKSFAVGAGVLRNAFKARDTFGLTGRDGLEGKFAVAGLAIRRITDGVGAFLYSLRTGFSRQDVRTGPESLGLALNRVARIVGQLEVAWLRFVGGALAPFAQQVGPSVLGLLRGVADAAFRFLDLLSSPQGEGARRALLALLGALAALKVAEDVAGRVNRFASSVAAVPKHALAATEQVRKLAAGIASVVSKTVSVGVDGAQAAVNEVQKVIDAVGRLAGKAVNVSAKASIDAGQAAKDATKIGRQLFVSFLTGFAAAAAAPSQSVIPVVLRAIGGLIGPIVTGIAAALGVSVAAVVGGIIALALALPLIIVFRKQIARFFTVTLPDVVGKALGAFPEFLGRVFGIAVSGLLLVFLGIPILLVRAIAASVPRVVGAVADLVVAMGRAIGRLEGLVLETASKIPGIVIRELSRLPGQVADVVESIIRFFGRLPTELPKFARHATKLSLDFFRGLPGDIIGFLLDLPDRVGRIFGEIPDLLLKLPFGAAAAKVFEGLVEGFRKGWRSVNDITDGALSGIVSVVRRGFAALVQSALEPFALILSGAEKAFGWIPVLKGPLQQAVKDFDAFRDGVNKAILGIGQDLAETFSSFERLQVRAVVSVSTEPARVPRLAEGGFIKARPGGTAAILGEGRFDEAVLPLAPGLLDALKAFATRGADAGRAGAQVSLGPFVNTEVEPLHLAQRIAFETVEREQAS